MSCQQGSSISKVNRQAQSALQLRFGTVSGVPPARFYSATGQQYSGGSEREICHAHYRSHTEDYMQAFARRAPRRGGTPALPTTRTLWLNVGFVI